jgi:hypothetical protein
LTYVIQIDTSHYKKHRQTPERTIAQGFITLILFIFFTPKATNEPGKIIRHQAETGAIDDFPVPAAVTDWHTGKIPTPITTPRRLDSIGPFQTRHIDYDSPSTQLRIK